jgi:hypothetical protein
VLSGKGVFSSHGIPEVTYSIPDVSAKVGDIIDLPINIGGKDLSLFDLDSFDVVLHYDPTVVYFHTPIITTGTLSSGYIVTSNQIADSLLEITGKKNSIVADSGRLFILKAEALLGPHDSTLVSIASSDPVNTADILTSSGTFIVSDCGNYRGGIIPKGDYSLSKISSNPVSSSAKIDYEIGLPGNVDLDLYDVLGRHSLSIIHDSQVKGKHSASFSTENIPSGEYVIVLRSLEFEGREKLMIAK